MIEIHLFCKDAWGMASLKVLVSVNKYRMLLVVKAELGMRQAASEGVEDEARRVLVTRPLAVTKEWTVYQTLDFVVD